MEAKKKYELTSETIKFNGVTLHRIKALKNFSDVKAGNLGGWVEKEENLSQTDNAWVYSNAKVYGNAKVFGDAQVFANAQVFGNAKVYGNAKVLGNAKVYGNAVVCDNAMVYGNSEVYGDAKVYDYAWVYDKSSVHGNARIRDYAEVHNNAEICGNAVVCDNADYIVFKNFWSSGRFFTWTRSNNMWKVGCFYGTGKELIEKAYADSETSGRECEKIVRLTGSTIDALNLFKFFTNGSKKEL